MDTRRTKAIVGIATIALVGVMLTAGSVVLEGVAGAKPQGREVLLETVAGKGPAPVTVPASPKRPALVPLVAPPVGRAPQPPFGGTGDNTLCDRELLVSFLTAPAHAAEAREWARVLDVKVAEIPVYVRDLVPTTLDADTRVTNHRFSKNKAVGYQAVLEKGTAVLVTQRGELVARCRCGNPLRAPQAVTNARYVGKRWSGFDPTTLIVVIAADIDIFPPGADLVGPGQELIEAVREPVTTGDCFVDAFASLGIKVDPDNDSPLGELIPTSDPLRPRMRFTINGDPNKPAGLWEEGPSGNMVPIDATAKQIVKTCPKEFADETDTGTNDGTYQASTPRTPCSDPSATVVANEMEFTVTGTKVTLVVTAAGVTGKPLQGSVEPDGTFSVSTYRGTFRAGQVQGSYHSTASTGAVCDGTFAGQRV
jgi:hypothetical protein